MPSLQLDMKAAANLLSEEQVRQYHKAGFLVLRDVLPRDAIEAVIVHKPDRMLPWVLYPAEYAINTLLKQVTAQVNKLRAKGWNSVFG
jgi:predicted TIM-barrel fold metal-dependent hydrolase